jgi:hypothetical protein
MAQKIHKVIVQPRSFVVAPTYRGPDRRTMTQISKEAQESRIQMVPSITTLNNLGSYSPEQGAQLIVPDFSLIAKVNRAAIASGKVSFEMIENEFVRDGMKDVSVLKTMFQELEKAIGSRAPLERMCSASTLIQARSDAYDYELASKVAKFLTDFCTSYFNIHNPTHKLLLEKHIQALQVILKTKMRGNGGQLGEELISDLGKLMLKLM